MIVALVVSLLLGAASLDGPQEAPGSDSLQLARVSRMVADAHRFLVENQYPDGSFSLLRSERESGADAPVAVTGLVALSLMASGHLPDQTVDRTGTERAVKRAVAWLVDHCLETGEQAGYITTDGDTVSKMHGQGYALLALTQAVGMYGDNAEERLRLAAAVQRGVDLVQRTQGVHGAWFYDPVRSTAHEGSITVCMIQALRGAKEAGFRVDVEVIRKAEEYMVKSQDPESGRFRYQLGSDVMSWSLTAAALATLNALGDYGSEMLDNGFDALRRHDPYTGAGRYDQFQVYGAFYAAQAYWAWRDKRLFDAWWPDFVDDVGRRQRPDGSFQHGKYGRVYATAMVSLTLQVPLGYLPMFQR